MNNLSGQWQGIKWWRKAIFSNLEEHIREDGTIYISYELVVSGESDLYYGCAPYEDFLGDIPKYIKIIE